MEKSLKTTLFGKLRIYLKSGENIKSDSLRTKLFPKNVQKSIIDQAKQDGLMNASAYQTHMGFSNFEPIRHSAVDNVNEQLTVCIELIDSRDKLEKFFLKHKDLFKDKVVVFKEVEFWEGK